MERLDRREYEHARAVAVQSGESFDAVLERMYRSRDTYGVSFAAYERSRLWQFSEKSIEERGRKAAKRAAEEQACCQAVCAATGRTEDQVRQDLALFNTNPYAKVTMTQYSQWELYRCDTERTEEQLRALRDRTALTKQLKETLERIDRGECVYEDITGALDRYYQITENTLTASDIEANRPVLERAFPGISGNEIRLRKLVTDSLVCQRLLGFLDWEYTLFELADMPFSRRLTYASNSFRMRKVLHVNDRRAGELFDNKLLTYQIFGEFYDRELLAVRSDADREAFAAFCRRHPCFVKKPVNGSMGSGVGLAEAHGEAETGALFDRLWQEMGEFICEERIAAHPAFRRLNADSVNTVRMTTYFDGKQTHILWPWQKIGRSGSFVDNAGSGGLIVAIDGDTGRLMAGAVDEDGRHYDRHPDSGLVFEGYQLPDWEGALALGRALSQRLAERVSGVRFVGWDITCTESGRWVVIEGNTFPQLVQQAVYGRGFHAELDSLIPG